MTSARYFKERFHYMKRRQVIEVMGISSSFL